MDSELVGVAASLERTGLAAVLYDATWTLVWVSPEMRALLDTDDDDALGIGKHMLEAVLSDTWARTITEETRARLFVNEFPRLVYDTPGGRAALDGMFRDAVRRWMQMPDVPGDRFVEGLDVFAGVQPQEPPILWTEDIGFLQRDLPPLDVVEVGVRLRAGDGRLVGTAVVYAPGLPARVLALVARGDEGMFRRMARLFEPGRRRAAILFSDLQGSALLSRRLSSATYFELVAALTTAVDDVVISHRGIVGKHSGDGATAFFLEDDLGSASRAARAAIEAARELCIAARDAATRVGRETGLVEPGECVVNVGVHWGGTLFMGQLVTGGRLEVTALGDEVNECARIQESARDGRVLASKVLIEHLDADDAAAAGIDPHALIYRSLSEIEGVPDKAVRDAGGIPVTVL